MTCHISFQSVTFTPSDTGVRIVVITDVPCHIFCRLTLQNPRIHKKAVLRRGLWLNDDVRFCFTVYEDNEQHEDGDTLIHTFWKENWDICTTKWCYFWGQIGAEIAVSTSPLFKYHNDGVSPVPSPDVMDIFNSIEPQLVGPAVLGAWSKVDCSHFVHPTATGVIIQCLNKSGIAKQYWGARKPGNVIDFRGQMALLGQLWAMVGLDDAKECELFSDLGGGMNFWITGYTDKRVTFLDTWVNIIPSVGNVYETKDLSAECPGAEALIIQIGTSTTIAQTYSLRMLGSTDDRYRGSMHDCCVIGCDNQQRIEIKSWSIAPNQCLAYVVGYITGGITTFMNAPSIGVTLNQTWQSRTLSTAGSTPKWAIIQQDAPWANGDWGNKKTFSLRDIKGRCLNQSWSFIHGNEKYNADFYRWNALNQFYKIIEIP